MDNTDRILSVKLTKEDADRLDEICRKSGLPVSTVIRRLIGDVTIKERRPKEISDLYTDINRTQVNINQIAKAANAGFIAKHDISRSQILLQKVCDLVYKVANN